jgi:hypothetical protein
MPFAQWVFLRADDGSFRPVTTAEYSRFHSGEVALTESGRSDAVVAELMVAVDQRAPVAIKNIMFRRHPLLKTGLRDPHAARQEVNLYELLISERERGPSPESRFARIQVRNRFQ